MFPPVRPDHTKRAVSPTRKNGAEYHRGQYGSGRKRPCECIRAAPGITEKAFSLPRRDASTAAAVPPASQPRSKERPSSCQTFRVRIFPESRECRFVDSARARLPTPDRRTANKKATPKSGFFVGIPWSGKEDSNLRPLRPERAKILFVYIILPTNLELSPLFRHSEGVWLRFGNAESFHGKYRFDVAASRTRLKRSIQRATPRGGLAKSNESTTKACIWIVRPRNR